MIAWHYTVGSYMPKITASGMLLPAMIGVEPPEKPVVWFSLNQQWEPTATKGLIGADGSRRAASIEEMWAMADGLFRFGMPARLLLSGEALCRAARINRKTWADLARAGKAAGADARDWFGHVGPAPISDMTLQAMTTPGGRWLEVPKMQAVNA